MKFVSEVGENKGERGREREREIVDVCHRKTVRDSAEGEKCKGRMTLEGVENVAKGQIRREGECIRMQLSSGVFS